jgi:hypothetical protein
MAWRTSSGAGVTSPRSFPWEGGHSWPPWAVLHPYPCYPKVDRDVPGAIRRRQGRRRPPKSVPSFCYLWFLFKVDRDVPGAIRRRQGRRRPPKSVPFLLICVDPCSSVVPFFLRKTREITTDEHRLTRMVGRAAIPGRRWQCLRKRGDFNRG